MAVDDVEFREFFASQYARPCRLGLLLTGDQAEAELRRAVLVLRFHDDLTEAEVARLLGLALGTVPSLAHRGLARLRDRLGSPDLDPTTPTRREAR